MKQSNEKKESELVKTEKTIHDFLPVHEKKVPLQAKIRESIYDDADKKRQVQGHTWVEIIEAALLAYAGKQK